MTKNLFLRLCLMMAVLFSLWQCMNEDLSLAENNPKRNNSEFFRHSSSGGLANRGGVDYVRILEGFNEEYNFTSKMPDQEGMPIWEKMRIVKGETTTSLMIPLSTDGSTISSILFAAAYNESNRIKGINNITNDELKRVVFDTSIPKEKRENLFYTFMAIDNYTFGNEVFTNIPHDLFVEEKLGEKNNRIVFHKPNFEGTTVTETVEQNGKLQVVQEIICVILRHCAKHGGGTCDNCQLCMTESCSHSTIFVYSYPDPETGVVIFGFPGGGGGQSNTPIPDPDPCGLTKVFYRVAPNCMGNEVPPLENTPCDKIKLQRSDDDFKKRIDTLKTKTGQKKETGYVQRTNGQYTYKNNATATNTKNTLDLGDLSSPQNKDIKGYMHTHVNNFTYYDDDAQMDMEKVGIKIFSPADIAGFMEMLSNAHETLTDLGDVYAIMVSSGQTYQIRFTGNQYQIKTFTKDQITNFGNLYVNYMADRLKNNHTIELGFFKFLDEQMNVKGVVLYRMNEDGTTKEIKLNAAKTDTTENDCPK